MNLTQIWQAALGTIQMQTPRHEFETWLKGTSLLALDSGTATVGTPSPFHKEGLENRYMGPVRRSLGDILGFPVQVRVVIAPGQMARPEAAPAVETTGKPAVAMHETPGTNGSLLPHMRPPTLRNGNGRLHEDERSDQQVVQLDLSSALRTGMLNPHYTFSRFIVGASNRMAHAACCAVAEQLTNAYNPLFLYGGVGLGKTHLLHAIGNYVLDRDPEINVLYVSSEKFTNDLINAIRRQQTEEFRIRYRNIDVLLIDDIQFIAGKESTQDEFFHTFNTLHAAGKKIVISSDRPPKSIMTLEERLRSRFEWGLIVDVQAPDLETRTAILRAKSEQMKAHIPGEVIDFLAHKIQSNIRQLEGSLNRVAAYAELNNAPITIDLAAAALADLIGNTRRRRITPEMILNLVSDTYGVDTRVIQGRGRSQSVVRPRQVAMYLLREETDCSLVDIGNLLGGRDHTTVMYGCDKIAEEMNADSRLRNEVLTLREKLYEQGEK